MAVTVETAAVFRGGGRRWFTLRAACAAEARALLNKHCDCDYCDHEAMAGSTSTADSTTLTDTRES